MKEIIMIQMKKKSVIWRSAVVLATLSVLCAGNVQAQPWSQQAVCPGWNNPTNFTAAGTGLYAGTHYEGRVGSKPSSGSVPNALTGETGVNWSTATVPNTAMEACTVTVASSNAAIIPSNKHNNRPFEIYSKTDQAGSAIVNRDPNTGTGNNALPFVPWEQYNTNDPTLDVQTDLTKSIRVGTTNGRPSGGDNCAALYYYLKVRPENALLYLYYSCVFQDGGHGTSGDPAFMLRVMKQNSSGQWVQASPTRANPPSTGTLCDTLAYFITATPGSGINLNDPNSGWHGSSGYNSVLWKQWDKVVINLAPMMYETVRIEVMVSGCYATVHYAYAYICGECRPMKITTGACPAGESTFLTTLTAPPGMRNYVWYRSEYGGVTPNNQTDGFNLPNSNPNSTAYFTFHRLTPEVGNTDSSNSYRVTTDDFGVLYRPNSAHQQGIPATHDRGRDDSLGNKQIFRCTVKSAINPAKEYESHIYTIVQNTKPTMDVDTLSLCGGDVQLRNTSFVTGAPSMVVPDSTIWSFYDNPQCTGTPDTVIYGGQTVTMHFDGSSVRGVKVRTNIDENDPLIPSAANLGHNECYSEKSYPIRPIQNPQGGFVASPWVLCDEDPTTLHDTTAGSTYRVWRFRAPGEGSSMTPTDSVVGRGEVNRTYTRSFSHDKEPIELTVRNGLFYLNPENQSDTIWCQNTLYDTVYVFRHPELSVTGDSVVCMGDTTNVDVSTIGVDSCVFQWSTSNGTITGGIPAGSHLGVQPYADTATFYVRVTSPQNCVAWDSIHAFRVNPKLKMIPADGQICPGQEVTLTGYDAHHYTWTATPADSSMALQDSLPTMVVTPMQNTTYTLVGHGSNDCDATPLKTSVTIHPYPVHQVELNPGSVDSEDPTVSLRDVSEYSVSSLWTFAGGEMEMGREVTHTFEEATGVDSVYVTLTNANDLGCDTSYTFSIPVNLYTAWFPNIFTPGSEDLNSVFRLYTINTYEHFHIYIYNRFGQLVFDSSDPSFEWDGTMADGSVCPQGTYVYICRYRKPGAYKVASIHGSISLVR